MCYLRTAGCGQECTVQQGKQVELSIDGDRIEIRPARPHYRLEEPVRQITPDNQLRPIDVPPVGQELL